MPDPNPTFTPCAVVECLRRKHAEHLDRAAPARLDPATYRVDWAAVARSLAKGED